MFIDLVGSTSLAGRLDPEDRRALITSYQSCCASVIGRFEGYLAKFMGDGVLAYFGWPTATRGRRRSGNSRGPGNYRRRRRADFLNAIR
jgi:class 3 adenylate cyclase